MRFHRLTYQSRDPSPLQQDYGKSYLAIKKGCWNVGVDIVSITNLSTLVLTRIEGKNRYLIAEDKTK